MPTPSKLTFRRFDTAQARALRDTVSLIHQDAYAENIASGDPFHGVAAFMQRFNAYTSREGFDLVIAYTNEGEPVGQTWGWALPPNTAAWNGLVDPDGLPPGFTDEDGTRTFSLSEIMVRQAWTGQSIAHALHDHLLAARPEQRAKLLVEPDNERAYRAYRAWGWRKIARLRPAWDNAPLYDVLIIDLPLKGADHTAPFQRWWPGS